MDRYLSIVEEHSNAAATIDKAKLKHVLAHTKVSEYARITDQDFRDMSAADRFALLQGHYSFMNKVTGAGIHSFVLSGFFLCISGLF